MNIALVNSLKSANLVKNVLYSLAELKNWGATKCAPVLSLRTFFFFLRLTSGLLPFLVLRLVATGNFDEEWSTRVNGCILTTVTNCYSPKCAASFES